MYQEFKKINICTEMFVYWEEAGQTPNINLAPTIYFACQRTSLQIYIFHAS